MDMQDCNLYLGETLVETPVMYIILVSSVALLVGAYVLLNLFGKKQKS